MNATPFSTPYALPAKSMEFHIKIYCSLYSPTRVSKMSLMSAGSFLIAVLVHRHIKGIEICDLPDRCFIFNNFSKPECFECFKV